MVVAVNAVDLIKAGAGGNIDLTADDWLDARRLGRAVKVDHAVHIAVVGDGQSLHTEGFGSFDERRYGRCAVQDGILRMYV